MRNRSRPEGSIAEGYLSQECLTFCSRYLDDNVETKLTRVGRNDDVEECITKELSIFSRPGRPLGSKNNIVTFSADTLAKAHRYVLFNCDAVSVFIA